MRSSDILTRRVHGLYSVQSLSQIINERFQQEDELDASIDLRISFQAAIQKA